VNQLPNPVFRLTPEIKPRSRHQDTRGVILLLLSMCWYMEGLGYLLSWLYGKAASQHDHWTVPQLAVTAAWLGFIYAARQFFRRERGKSWKQWATAPW
jgi:hypothetical protein